MTDAMADDGRAPSTTAKNDDDDDVQTLDLLDGKLGLYKAMGSL